MPIKKFVTETLFKAIKSKLVGMYDDWAVNKEINDFVEQQFETKFKHLSCILMDFGGLQEYLNEGLPKDIDVYLFNDSKSVRDTRKAEILKQAHKHGGDYRDIEALLIAVLDIAENYHKSKWSRDDKLQQNNIIDNVVEALSPLSSKMDEMPGKIAGMLAPNHSPPPTTPHNLTMPAPPVGKVFRYRDEIVSNLRNALNQNIKLALINGLGGIGKTTIAKELYRQVKNNYAHVAWVEYQNSIKDSLLNSIELFNDIKDSNNRYREIRNFLLNATEDTIIFIDNASDDDIEGLGFIEKLAANVVLTSRASDIGNFAVFPVKHLSEDHCVDIFYLYYQRDEARVHEKTVRELVKRVKCHTLTVELLARVAKELGYPLDAFAAHFEGEEFEYPELDVSTNHTATPMSITRHLVKLFELVNVSDEERRILVNFAAMPSVAIPAEVVDWVGCGVNDLARLAKLGWLDVSDAGYEMHTIVKEAIWLQYRVVEYGDFEVVVGYMSGDKYISDADIYTKVHARLGIAESVMGCLVSFEREEIGRLLNNIAYVYDRQGDYAKALEWHLKALVIKEKVLGLDHPSTATSYNNIGLVYNNQGDYAKALEWYQKALKICKKVLGLEHPYTATSYSNIGLLYDNQGDYAKALEWHQESLKIREKVLGLEHPDTATSYNNIGLVYDNQGDYAKALEWYQKALLIFVEKLGPEHPHTMIVNSNIAAINNLLK